MVEEIETMICRFIQTGNYRTTREQIFLSKEMGGLGIPHVREFWKSLRLDWLNRTFHSESFWLELLKENCRVKTPPLFWAHDQAKREVEALKTITYAAALLNVMSAQLEFINTKYNEHAKSRAAMEINFFLHNLNRLRKDIRLM